jgi:4-hydroxybenzoate polyprenyltransferase
MDRERSRWTDELTSTLKVSRPGFWLTSVWFYLLPLGGTFVFGSWKFWLGCFYVTFPLGLLIYGWNDIADYETDRHNPRKGTFLFGAKATLEQLRGLPLRIALVQLPFIVVFYWLEGARVLLWAAALLCATAIYNGPRGGLKGRPPFEMLNQIGYLLVFVIASWLNNVPQLPWFTFVFGALFAMHSHLFGQIMDVVPDRLANRRTSAVQIGIVQAKLLLVLFMASEAIIVGWFSADKLMAAFLALSAAWFAADALLIWRDRLYETWQMRLFLLGWNVIALVTMPIVWWSAGLTRASN